MSARSIALVCLLIVASSTARAVEADEVLADGVLEGRARAISAELRCLVCQNQSIDDSDAPLARDLRVLVRERLKAGDTDEGIRQFLASRYGDFVLLRPPFSGRTLALWLGPVAVLGVAGGIILTRRRRSSEEPARLTSDEERRLQALLGEKAEVP